jgi:hypothetical protein
MSILKTQTALIDHLKTLTPTLPTAYEGVSFTPPTGTYQRVQFLIQDPTDPVLGTGYYRENLELQIFVNSPNNKGVGEALSRAELLRVHFKKGLTIQKDTLRIHILETPRISGSAVIGDRLIVPILIPVVSEVLCD